MLQLSMLQLNANVCEWGEAAAESSLEAAGGHLEGDNVGEVLVWG